MFIRRNICLEEKNKDLQDKGKDLEDHKKDIEERSKDLETVQLSAKGIRGLDSKNFVFDIGGDIYLCGRIQACFASKRVC